VFLLIDQEFDGAGIGVVGRLRGLDGHFAHAPAHVGIDNRRRRLLENFLVAALDGTFALAEPDGIAVLVGQYLHLDVARIDDRLLDIDFAVAERTLRFALRRFERGTKFLARVHQAHAFATPASRCLQHHGVADALRDFFAFFGRGEAARGSGNKRYAGFFHLLTGAGFRAHHSHGVRSGPYKLHARIGARLRELRVFREEAVAGMDRLSARAFRDVENLVYPQIRLRGSRRADVVGLVGLTDMECSAVDIGIDG